MHAGCVGEDGLHQLREGQPDSPGGVALQLDDFVRTLHHLGVCLLPILLIRVQANVLVEIPETHACDVHT